MTKKEWLDCKDLEILLKEVKDDRKRQLFALVCCRSIEHLMQDQRSKDCLTKLELFIDGKIDNEELELARQAADDAWTAADAVVIRNVNSAYTARAAAASYWAATNAAWSSADAAARSVYWAAWPDDDTWSDAADAADRATDAERAKQLDFLKDIYNPFLLNLTFCNEAKNIAQKVYDGDNDARLILSDYLEENKFPEELYLHLKQLNHYKGCWVIDQILEKS